MGLGKLVNRARTYAEYAKLMDEAGDAFVKSQNGEPLDEREAELALAFEAELTDIMSDSVIGELAAEAREFTKRVMVP